MDVSSVPDSRPTLTGSPLEVPLLPRKAGLAPLIPVGLKLSPNVRHKESVRKGGVYETDGRK